MSESFLSGNSEYTRAPFRSICCIGIHYETYTEQDFCKTMHIIKFHHKVLKPQFNHIMEHQTVQVHGRLVTEVILYVYFKREFQQFTRAVIMLKFFCIL